MTTGALKIAAKPIADANISATRYVYDSGTGTFLKCRPALKFIKGPIPYEWQRRANSLPGKAGQVGLALWFLSGVRKSKIVKVTNEAEKLSGCVRQTFSRGLASLEESGLVLVTRNPGQKPLVEILQEVDNS